MRLKDNFKDAAELKAQVKKYMIETYERMDFVAETADGIYMYDENGVPYLDRDKEFPYKITRDDLCCRLFLEHGFNWGGDWENSKDYQHFEMPSSVVKSLYPD